MIISLTRRAEADLQKVFTYISTDGLKPAGVVVTRILQSIAMLEAFPNLGRTGRVRGTRELSVARLPYYVVYRLLSDTEIEVIAILHHRQQFPEVD